MDSCFFKKEKNKVTSDFGFLLWLAPSPNDSGQVNKGINHMATQTGYYHPRVALHSRIGSNTGYQCVQ